MAGWGHWFEMVGLVLTIVGFIITWRQISKTKSAAQAVSAEVNRIRLSLTSYDAAQEASKAEAALHSTKRHLLNNAWADVADSYEDFRRSIVGIKHLEVGLDIKLEQDIDAADQYIARLCERIENHIQTGSAPVEQAKTITMIRKHGQLIATINMVIHKGVIQ